MGHPDVSLESGDQYLVAQVGLRGLAHLTVDEVRLVESALARAAGVVTTLVLKRRDYGSANINTTGLYGVAVRLSDKVARLLNLTSQAPLSGPTPAVAETIADTLGDTVGYGLIGMELEEGGSW